MSIVIDGLVGYWNSRQGVNGSVWENISPNTTGQYNGSITGTTLQSEGIFFDGVDDYVTTSPLPTVSEFTLEICLNASVSNNSSPSPLSYYLSDSIRGALGLRFNNNYNALSWSDNQGGSPITTPTGSMTRETRTYITIRVKDRNTEVLINGITVGSGNSTYGNQRLGGNLTMGHRYYNATIFEVFKGTIFFVRAYNKLLTNSEVAQNYAIGTEVGLTQEPPSPVTNLQQTSVRNTTVELNWDDSPNASYYIIKRNGVEIAEIASSNYSDTGLTKNTTYNYEVLSKNYIGIASPTPLSVTTTNITTTNVTVLEDFEDTSLNYAFTGDWISVTNVPASPSHSGIGALRSKAISHSASSISTFQLSIPSDATNIKFEFKYKVSSESGFDFFTAKIGSSFIVSQTSGEIDWTTYSNTSLTTGTHTVTLEYSKDSSVSKGMDLAYVDDISLTYDILDYTPTEPPVVLYVSADKLRISDEIGMNQSVVQFRFDKDIAEWTVRVLGTSNDSGTLADSGGPITANTTITAIVDHTELYQEGDNRINIYGKSTGGNWTPYGN